MALLVAERLERLTTIKAQLLTVTSAATAQFWELGRLLGEIERDGLWTEDGATSFRTWTEEQAGVSYVTARKAITVAQQFSEEAAVRYGTEKLRLGLQYAALTKKEEQPGDIAAMTVAVQGGKGRFKRVPFPEASTRELQEAIRLMRASNEAKRRDMELSERATALQARLASPGGAGPTVKVARHKDGRVMFTFKDVAEEELDGLIAALQALRQ